VLLSEGQMSDHKRARLVLGALHPVEPKSLSSIRLRGSLRPAP
jgi:hypothetical protein